jgi:hypothetical protein
MRFTVLKKRSHSQPAGTGHQREARYVMIAGRKKTA